MSKALFERFACARESEVAHWFASLPGAIRSRERSRKGAPLWVYREGTAPAHRRVLLRQARHVVDAVEEMVNQIHGFEREAHGNTTGIGFVLAGASAAGDVQ